MSEQELRRMLQERFSTRSSRLYLENKYGVTRQYVTNIINLADRSIPTWMLKEVGLVKKKVTIYEAVK